MRIRTQTICGALIKKLVGTTMMRSGDGALQNSPEKHANDADVAKNAVNSMPGCTARAMLTSGPKVKP